MKHIIVGGDGFVGRYIARDLLDQNANVIVCDLKKSPIPIYDRAKFIECDITNEEDVSRVPFERDDVVYNVAARMLHPIVSRKQRHEYFFSVDYVGAKHVVDIAMGAGCSRLVQFSTDMVYGRLLTPPPIKEDHPRNPIGEYSDSKRCIEDYCIEKRNEGLRVSIFRPRLIIGPGRLGVLGKLFKLIQMGLPVPMIGAGNNRYQMVSVFDCASAAVLSGMKGVVEGEFNLGSETPPKVKTLLRELIDSVRSRSILVPTPASLVKSVLRALDAMNLSLMVPEQYEVADLDYVIDIEHTKSALGWVPTYDDRTMFHRAFDDFVNGRETTEIF